MLREELLKITAARLQSMGFDVFSSSDIGGCFDIACRKAGKLYLLKVLANIDSLDSQSAKQLQAVSEVLGGECLVIGQKSKSYALEDYIVYERQGITACTLGTLETILSGGEVLERKFNRKLSQINGASLRKIRECQDLSITELSELSGVSEDTIYRYEHSITLATPKNIEKLESALGKGIEKINLIGSSGHQKTTENTESMIFNLFGFDAVKTAGPADIVGTSAKNRKISKYDQCRLGQNKQQNPPNLQNSVTFISERDRDLRTLERKSAQFEMLSQTIRANPFFIVKKTTLSRIGDIPMLTHDEISKIRTPSDLVRVLGEKKRR